MPPSSKLRNFNSLVELRAFLADDKTDEIEYISETFDCDDFALTLTQNAVDKAYWMHTTLWWQGKHVMNMAFVECEDGVLETYLIETDEDLVLFLYSMDRWPEGVDHNYPEDVKRVRDTKFWDYR